PDLVGPDRLGLHDLPAVVVEGQGDPSGHVLLQETLELIAAHERGPSLTPREATKILRPLFRTPQWKPSLSFFRQATGPLDTPAVGFVGASDAFPGVSHGQGQPKCPRVMNSHDP